MRVCMPVCACLCVYGVCTFHLILTLNKSPLKSQTNHSGLNESISSQILLFLIPLEKYVPFTQTRIFVFSFR